jgi:hypothetical protein
VSRLLLHLFMLCYATRWAACRTSTSHCHAPVTSTHRTYRALALASTRLILRAPHFCPPRIKHGLIPRTPLTQPASLGQRRRSSLDGWSSGTRAAPGRCRTAHHRASAACLASHLCIMRGGCRYRYPDMERFFQQASPYQEGSAARAVLEGVAWRPREHLSPCGSTRGPRQRSCA